MVIILKNTYTTHTYTTSELNEDNPQLAEQMILEQIRKENSLKKVIRPEIKVWKDLLQLAVSVVVTISLLLLVRILFPKLYSLIFFLLCVITGVIWCIFNLKRLLINLIILYQKYAPEKVRSACLFEPCCSEYMKQAILKYGVISGTFRGIKRILRCRYPNGGIDEP